MTRAELKRQAKDNLRGRWGWAVGLVFVGGIMTSLVGGLTFGLLALVIPAGISFTFLSLIDDEPAPGVLNGVFSGFTRGRGWPLFVTNLLIQIFLFLWSLLFVIPGLVKAFSYSQANYIIKDMNAAGREIQATDAIKASQELMKGHKWELFTLHLSFMGWAILAAIPFGLGYLWLAPYMEATLAAYYRDLAGDQFLPAAKPVDPAFDY